MGMMDSIIPQFDKSTAFNKSVSVPEMRSILLLVVLFGMNDKFFYIEKVVSEGKCMRRY